MDVKYVPAYCVADGQKYYQFTAKDECTRWTYREMYAEHSTASAKDFLEKLVRTAPFPVRMIQTDNGTEFTNALLVTKSKHKTLFEMCIRDRIDARLRLVKHGQKRVPGQHRSDFNPLDFPAGEGGVDLPVDIIPCAQTDPAENVAQLLGSKRVAGGRFNQFPDRCV